MGPYDSLLDIQATHDYFADQICRPLDWVPAAATRQTMDNLGMLLRRRPGGVALYFDQSQSEALSLFAAQSEAGQSSFYFKLYSTDPFFVNYTDLPEVKAGMFLCLDSATAKADGSGGLRLHKSAFVSEQSLMPLVDLADARVLTRHDRGSPPLCVVRIRLVGKKGCPLDPGGGIHPQSYRICFSRRSTFWKYYITGALAKKKVSIQDKGDQWVFDAAPSGNVALSQPVSAFMSKKPIPLAQAPNFHFQLRLHAVKAGKVMINRLPSAPVNILHREKRGAKEILVSEIFINS